MQIAALPEEFEVLPPDGVTLVRANNPGPLSLSGTNTWILAGRSGAATVVIDPGPPLAEHLAAIRAAGTPTAILLTHHHIDHSEAAPELAAEFGIPVYAALPELALGSLPLVEGVALELAGWQIDVLATPGHTNDSVCFAVGGALFTGDTLLGGSTTIIAPPTGSLADYFATMQRLGEFAATPGLPGHGPAFSSVGAWATSNAEYREQRLAQLVEVYRREAENGTERIVSRVANAEYGDGIAAVEPYVETMTSAQLDFLGTRGDIDYRA